MVLNSNSGSGYGHDKSKAILPYRDLAHKPTLFFCGDGVSGECEPYSNVFLLPSLRDQDSLTVPFCDAEQLVLIVTVFSCRHVGGGPCGLVVRQGDGEWGFGLGYLL